MAKHTERAWWAPVVHALVHVAIGTAIFIIIALAALLLGLFVHWLEPWVCRATSSTC